MFTKTAASIPFSIHTEGNAFCRNIFRGSASFITITMTIWFYSRDKKAILKKVEKENRKVDPIYKRRSQNINNKLKSNNNYEFMKN